MFGYFYKVFHLSIVRPVAELHGYHAGEDSYESNNQSD